MRLTYDELKTLQKQGEEEWDKVTFDMLPILTDVQKDELYPTLEDMFNGIYGKKTKEYFTKEVNLSPSAEIRDYKGYLTYLKENISRIHNSQNLSESNNLKLNEISNNIEEILYDNNKLGNKNITHYLNYLCKEIENCCSKNDL